MHVGSADKVQPLGIGGGLGIAAAQAGQRRCHQRADFQIALLRFFRQPRVGQKKRHAGLAAAVHQIGPDFGFHQNAQARAVFIEKLADIGGLVVRQIAALRIGKKLLGSGAAGGRHLGEQQRRIGKILFQRGRQRHGGAGFPHRHGMYPNRLLHRLCHRRAETLAPMLKISA